jgi:hypothetical protein
MALLDRMLDHDDKHCSRAKQGSSVCPTHNAQTSVAFLSTAPSYKEVIQWYIIVTVLSHLHLTFQQSEIKEREKRY